ncbi:ThuA domain-containing protein [Paenibacillus sp. MMS20-IR301]|uniref:ThuA domain-containing protein n=1 Tax=Paenibacillus sp. MMS20-IR301 TaxID=2895946 RepID=UPI0028E43296|nr:ThuA domain-containing protein [Paenibacillus sp. MMS20-IR301]WNS41704.1 ThuA domain-containing protein [Paenibacillus sp. MMS20-IR301]
MASLKALAFGSYSEVKYHPFAGVDREIEGLLAPDLDVISTEDYGLMNPQQLAECSLVVSYTEFSDQPLSAAESGALLSYVAGGGGLLVIHNGISLQRNQELGLMLGAHFTHHPDYTALQMSITAPEHPIMDGISNFVIEDEPYYFEQLPYFATTVLAEYPHGGAMRQAAWCHPFGQGRIVYLMPGHHLPSFSVEPFRRMIRRGGLWAAGLL